MDVDECIIQQCALLASLTNETSNTTDCSGLDDSWWKFLTAIAGIYIVGLLCCLLGYGLYWLLQNKRKGAEIQMDNTSNEDIPKTMGKMLRDYMRQLMSGDSNPGKILVTVTLLFNIAYICLTLRRSFQDVEICITITTPQVLVELVLVCVLLIFSLVRFLACNNPVHYWIDIYTIVDVCTLFHIFITIILGVDWIGLRSLRFIWLTQITVVLQFTPLVRTQTVADGFDLLIYFFVIWFTSSGIIHVVELQGDFWLDEDTEAYNIFDYVYFTLVTMSTVGYGDISPLSEIGRLFVIIFIIGGLAFFGAISPKILDLSKSYYNQIQYASFDRTRVPRHVIVSGHITAISAKDFIKDFLHPDRDDTRTHILFMHPEWPDQDLKNVLRTHYKRIQYIRGSLLKAKDLKKAHISSSSAIFILADKNANNPTEEDHGNLLRVVSVKNYTTKVSVIIQLLHSFSKTQVKNIEGWSPGRDIAVCLNELKLGLLAQSCLCPGFSTLIANLFYTSDFPMSTSFTGDDTWKKHYFKGASNEVYADVFSEHFDDITFQEAATICFEELNLVLLALELVGEDTHHYYINPSVKCHPKLRIKPNTMLGYFIAQDQSHVSAVSTYAGKEGEDPLQFHRKKEERAQLKRKLTAMRKKKTLHIPPISIDNGTDVIVDFHAPSSMGNRKHSVPIVLNEVLDEGDDSDDDDNELIGGQTSQLYISEPITLNEAVINPDVLSVEKQSLIPKSDIKDHIILCLFANGNSPLLGLHNFLKPLRSKHLPQDSIKPVVIVCEKAFIEKEWPIIRKIPKVYLVEGSPLLWSNLRAARVTHCSVCVVLTLLDTSCSHERAIDDKEVVLCTLNIRRRLKKIRKSILLITDLRLESNVQFLDFGDEDTPDERIYKSQPFACGESFSVSMFDSITSSVFYSPGTLYLVEDLIHSSGSESRCQVISLQISNTVYSRKPFGDFYKAMLTEGKLCLGLSRKLTYSGNQRYVIACPEFILDLEETDFAFILTEY